MAIQSIILPFLHDKISVAHIQANGKLFSDEQIIAIKNLLKDKKDGRYRKALLGSFSSKFGVIKLNNNYYAVYYGEKHGRHVSKSGHVKVKLVQELESGKWYLLKSREYNVRAEINLEKDKLGEISYDKEALEEHYKRMVRYHENLAITNQAREYVFYRFSKRNTVKFYLLMDLIPGEDLNEFIKRRPKLADIRWLEIVLEMLYSTQELHKKNYLHGDIKPDNMIYHPAFDNLTIIDVDSLVEMNADRQGIHNRLLGSDLHLAPEFYRMYEENNRNDTGQYIYDEKTEAFALGSSIKVLLKIPIITLAGPGNTLHESIDKTYQIGSEKIFSFNNKIIKFLDGMMNTNANERYSINDAIEFFEDIYHEMLPKAEIKVGLFYYDEFKKFYEENTEFENQAKINILKQLDEVCLLSKTAEIDTNEMISYQRFLKKWGITHFHSILVVPDLNVLAQVPAFFQNPADLVKRNYVHISFSNVRTSETELLLAKIGIKTFQFQPKKNEGVQIEEINSATTRVSEQIYQNGTGSAIAGFFKKRIKRIFSESRQQVLPPAPH